MNLLRFDLFPLKYSLIDLLSAFLLFFCSSVSSSCIGLHSITISSPGRINPFGFTNRPARNHSGMLISSSLYSSPLELLSSDSSSSTSSSSISSTIFAVLPPPEPLLFEGSFETRASVLSTTGAPCMPCVDIVETEGLSSVFLSVWTIGILSPVVSCVGSAFLSGRVDSLVSLAELSMDSSPVSSVCMLQSRGDGRRFPPEDETRREDRD
mmetsp:Transcript_5834/g.14145  ORF Transcript_5834/g.14145 Transcript_5834/m.14145 type:complete len:210 (+) Transcript_5834:4758-5387(+)